MRFLRDRSGAAILEYGLAIGLVAMLAIAALLILGEHTDSSLRRSSTFFSNASSNANANGLSATP